MLVCFKDVFFCPLDDDSVDEEGGGRAIPPAFADHFRLHAGGFSSFSRAAYLLKTVQL